MDFALNDEQRLVQDSVARLLADRYGFAQRKAHGESAEGWSRALWAHYAELGLLGVALDPAHGGSGGGPVESMIVAEAFGRALVLEPWLATVVLGGGLLRHAGTLAQQAALLPRLADGRLTLAFAHNERESRWHRSDVTTRARRDGDAWVLDGAKAVVLHGDSADRLIVSARSAGARRDAHGLGLFLVDPAAPGVTRRGYPTQDGLRAAEVTLAGVRVPAADALGDPAGAFPAIARVIDEAVAALCAEAVGAMDALIALTTDWLKTRKQFGVAIGSFQALQHRAVDMLVAAEQARSMALLATMSLDAEEAERTRALAAAKVQVGRSARFVGQQAIQLHGGIGMTLEAAPGHYFKRLTAIDLLFGDADHHLQQLAL